MIITVILRKQVETEATVLLLTGTSVTCLSSDLAGGLQFPVFAKNSLPVFKIFRMSCLPISLMNYVKLY